MRTEIISVRVSPEERQWLEHLAQREERTLGDTLRRVIRQQAAQQHDRAPSRQEVSAAASVAVPTR